MLGEHAVFGGRKFVCVHSVQWNTVWPCAVSGGTSFVCVCVCVQCLVGTSLVCVHSVWWYIACVCSVLWYKLCVCVRASTCACAVSVVHCARKVHGVTVCMCVCGGGVCAVSGGTQYVCGVQGLVADPV